MYTPEEIGIADDIFRLAAEIDKAVSGASIQKALTALAMVTGNQIAKAIRDHGADPECVIQAIAERAKEAAGIFVSTGTFDIQKLAAGIAADAGKPEKPSKPEPGTKEHLLYLVDIVEAIDKALEGIEETSPIDKFFAVAKVLGILAVKHPRGAAAGANAAEDAVTSSMASAMENRFVSVADYVAMVRREARQRTSVFDDRAKRSQDLSDMLSKMRGADQGERSDIDISSIFKISPLGEELEKILEKALKSHFTPGDGSGCPLQPGDTVECTVDQADLDKYSKMVAATPTLTNFRLPRRGETFSVMEAERVPEIHQPVNKMEGFSEYAIGIDVDGKRRKLPANWFTKVENVVTESSGAA